MKLKLKPTPVIFTPDNIDMETIQSNPHKLQGSEINFQENSLKSTAM